MPHGIQYSDEIVNSYLPEPFGASERIANVMEFVVNHYLRRNIYPEARKYSYDSFQVEIEPSVLVWNEIKQKRLKNFMYGITASDETEYVTAPLDFSVMREFADRVFSSFETSLMGQNEMREYFYEQRARFFVENSDLLSTDDINQSILLESMYTIGLDDKIILMSPDSILCHSQHSYYCMMISNERKEFDEVVKHATAFLIDYSSRDYIKYKNENENLGVKRAYELLFRHCNNGNITPELLTRLLAALYFRATDKIKPELLKRAYSVLIGLSLQPEEERMSFRVLSEDERLNRVNYYKREFDRLFNLRSTGVFRKGKKNITSRFRQCWKDHGFVYTFKLAFKKIGKIVNAKMKRIIDFTPIKLCVIGMTKVCIAFAVYSDTLRTFGSETTIYLTSIAIGEFYYLAKWYLKNDLENRKLVYWVFGKSGAGVADIYGIRNRVELSTEEIFNVTDVLSFIRNSGMSIEKRYLFLAREHTAIINKLCRIRIPNIIRFHYELKDAEGDVSELVQPHFQNYDIEKRFENDGFVQNNTVVLAPYAKAMKALSLRFWEDLAQELSSRGFTVATNVNLNNPAEKPIIGTATFDVPINELVPALEMAGCIIGLRSGLMDVAESAKACKISLMRSDQMSNYGVTPYKMFDLWKMTESYDSPDLYDFEYSDRRKYTIIQDICNIVDDYFSRERGRGSGLSE